MVSTRGELGLGCDDACSGAARRSLPPYPRGRAVPRTGQYSIMPPKCLGAPLRQGGSRMKVHDSVGSLNSWLGASVRLKLMLRARRGHLTATRSNRYMLRFCRFPRLLTAHGTFARVGPTWSSCSLEIGGPLVA